MASAADRHSYERIAAVLLAAIESGEYRPGVQLPSEKELQAEYGVGRNTAQRALRVLIDGGWAEPRPKRGVFVRGYDRQRVDTSLTGGGRELGAQVSVEKVRPHSAVAELLPGEPTVWRRRVRSGALRDTYLPSALVVDVPELGEPIPLVEPPDIALIEGARGSISRQKARVIARMPSSDEAALLDLPPGTPVLEQTTALLDAEERVIAVRVALYAGDRHFLDFDLPT